MARTQGQKTRDGQSARRGATRRPAASVKMRPMERLRWLATWAIKVLGCWMVACIGLVVLLRFVPLPVSMVMLEKWGYSLVSGAPMALQHDWVPMEKISRNARLAVIASEDQKFPDHYGFDVDQIVKAIDARLAGERLRGASTISQQTAKNVFLWNGRSWVRKGLEVWFTILIEVIWPKERILEVYLNVAEWGPGVFGVEAAAVHHFNTDATNLSAYQASLLAAVLPNPIRFNAGKPSAYIQRRASWTRRQMNNLGMGYLKRLEQPRGWLSWDLLPSLKELSPAH
ncbi:monofunctional biosynthetic peptidoglycan transglycosylase [Cobetia sp. MMG027]|nr:monofunctional biosynthetic peptidoglycan transglycosylase [Cobetia sp. MMG027]MDA5563044.1 monofunctional biosynthetic peptidoglycan transglycosylase [Cobetia sp. MMG027]